MSHPNVTQAFECFVVGLVSLAWILVLVCLLIFLGSKIEAPVEHWFLRHPKVGKGVALGCWALIGCGACFCIFKLGCSITGAK